MEFKEEPFYLSIVNSIRTKNENFIIDTLCERTTLFENESDIRYPILKNAQQLVRLLDKRVQLPLDDLFDPEELTEDDLSEENVEKMMNDTKASEYSWSEYKSIHPIETKRQFLSSAHFLDCNNVFTNIKKNEKPVLREPLLSFFSEREKTILNQKESKIKEAKLEVIKKFGARGHLATSFLKLANNEQDNEPLNPGEIKNLIYRMGFNDNHTGFAIGNIPDKMGVIEFDGIDKDAELKHVNFWEYRTSYDVYNIVQDFSFYDL